MKSIITTMGICLLLAAATQIMAQEQKDTQQKEKDKQSAVKAEETVIRKATVQDVDKEKREVTLKGEEGNTVTFKVPETVRNFDQIKEGDIVTAKYSQSIALAVRKSDEPPSATGRESISRTQPGQKPGFKKTETIQINASVEKIDRDKRELTLKGPEGKTRTVKVPEDIKKFDDLKEQDQVVVTATESIGIEVTKPQE